MLLYYWLFIFIIIMILLFLSIMIFLLFFSHQESTSTKTFILNKKTQKIIYFDNTFQIKNMSLNHFLCLIKNVDLYDWLNEKHKKNDSLKLEKNFLNIKQISIFKVIEVNKNILSFSFDQFNFLKMKNDKEKISINNFIARYPNFSFNGFVLVFNFFNSNQLNFKKINEIVFLKLKKIIFFYFQSKSQYIFDKNNSIVVFYNQKNKIIEIFINKIIRKIYCFLQFSGYNNIFVTVGVVFSKSFSLIEKTINKAENLSLKAFKLKKNVEIFNFDNNINNQTYYLIKKNISNICWRFIPLYDLLREEKIGYLVFLHIQNDFLNKKLMIFNDFLVKNNKKNKLFDNFFKNLLVKFDNKLLIFCNYHPNIIDALSINNNIITCFDDTYVNFCIENQNINFLEEILQKIKNLKCLICFTLNYKNYEISEKIIMNSDLMVQFDFFIINLDKSNCFPKQFIKNVIVEILLKYKKPIIINCDKKHIIKKVIRSDIEFISTSLDCKKIFKIKKNYDI